jgi:hypothetical protein
VLWEVEAAPLRAGRTHDMTGRPERGGEIQSAPTDPSRSETSARVGFCPQALKRSPRLALGTRPLPLLSNKAKASRYWSVEEGCPPQRLASGRTMQKRHSNTAKGVQCKQQDLKPKRAGGCYHQKKSGDVWLFDLWLVEMVKAHTMALRSKHTRKI